MLDENADLRAELSRRYDFSQLLGDSGPMLQVYEQIAQVACTSATVLINGETGTGKELVAGALHANSPRASRPFIKVNCAALTESLIETELFGHERGAFTDAATEKPGRFELAEGGTLFLDEIGELSLNAQVKLLRVLQEREFERVGGTETRKADVRVIAATNRDLEREVNAVRFRADLYYRLNMFTITTPPLRERREDIALLARFFLNKHARDHRSPPCRLTPSALELLKAHDWPGNVRELENALERALVVAGGALIHSRHLPSTLQTLEPVETGDLSLLESVEAYERRLICDALRITRGNRNQASKRLQISERLLSYKVKKHAIDCNAPSVPDGRAWTAPGRLGYNFRHWRHSMKFPYGIADFHKLITAGYFYADRTGHIPAIENAGEQLLFLRPRRFGKSLLLSMLENYYDLARTDDFERLFGHLAIGQAPTPKRNQYFVMKWDFSGVNPHGEPADIERALHNYLNRRIENFAESYQEQLARPIQIEPGDALASFQSLLTAVRLTPHRLYLLIDEYDNFANEILMSGTPVGRQRYESLLRGEGALKTVFKAVKAAAAGEGLDRVFITGVAPLVLSDLTSGYNVAENIYLDPRFQDLCGFTEAEISQAMAEVTTGCGLQSGEADQALAQMRLYYNGYRFDETSADLIYNPTLALYFLKHFQSQCKAPSNMLDNNLAMDRGKLSYIARLPDGPQVIVDALQDEDSLNLPVLADRFGVEDLLTVRQDRAFMASLLYYFGVLTLAGRGALGKLQLRIPNLVMRKLYVERLQALLLPQAEQDDAQRAAETVYQMGNLQPLCEFIEQRYFKVFDNRDYMQANELTVKTAFLTLLFNDLLYIMDSETAAGRRYADLTMIVRPDARQYQIFDLLLEFKFLKPGDPALSGEQFRGMSRAELAALPCVREKLAEARAQTADYLRELRQRYRTELRMRIYAVVAIGFDRLVWEEIEPSAIAA